MMMMDGTAMTPMTEPFPMVDANGDPIMMDGTTEPMMYDPMTMNTCMYPYDNYTWYADAKMTKETEAPFVMSTCNYTTATVTHTYTVQGY